MIFSGDYYAFPPDAYTSLLSIGIETVMSTATVNGPIHEKN